MKAKDLWNPVQRYSIRKYSIGVTSIALGTVLLGAGSTVAADQLSVETPQLAPQSELVENHSVPSLGDVVYAAPAQPQAISVSLTADQLQEFPERPAQDLPASGAYTFAETVGVKNELSKDADVAFYLQAGDQVHYDQLHNQEGYQWLSYKSYSGQRRYAPIGVQTAPAVAPQPEKELEPALPTSGTFQFDGRYGIKKEARVASPDVAYYDKGSSVNYDKVVESDGYRWLSYLSYSGNRHYIALEKLASAPKVEAKPVVKEAAKVETKPVVKETAKVEASGLAASGNFRFDGRYGIKKEARVASPDVAYYDKGSSVNYDKVVESDGYRWLSYLSYSGNRHYIAFEKLASAPKVEAKPVVKEAAKVETKPVVKESAKVEASGLAASGNFRFDGRYGIKKEARVASPDVAYYDKGSSVNYDRVLESDGYRWLSYLSYSGNRHYIALEKLASAPKVEAKPVVKESAKVEAFGLAASGNFRFDGRYGIKKEARVSSPDVAYYDKGSSVNYDKVVESDGYRWLSYLSYSGNRHYIALEKLASAPKVEAKPVVKESAKVEASGLAASGSYVFRADALVKNQPQAAAEAVALYEKGMSVNYDRLIQAEGRNWLSYISASGVRRYVALPF